MFFIRTVALFLLIGTNFFICLTPLVLAQTGATTGTITGVIQDRTNAVISGAKITARQVETNLTYEVVSEEKGNYIFAQLPPGKYEIIAQATGFTNVKEVVILTLGTTALIDFFMDIAGTDPNVILVTVNQNLEPKTESSTNIEQARIEGLPSQQRNFLDFSIISPRVLADRLPSNGVVATSGISANSQSARFNNITIDGLDNNDHVSGAARSSFGQDAVQEFQVITDSYSAEFGRVLGGIVNIVTRGGTNEFRGESFFLNRNDAVAARDVFARKKQALNQYQFGALFSGPIKKDKTFLFTSFERLTAEQSNIVTLSQDAIRVTQNEGFNLRNGIVTYAVGTTSVLARVDSQLSPNSTLWVRYNGGFNYDGSFQDFRGLIAETAGGIQRLSDNTIAASNTYISTKFNLVNEARLLFSRRDQDILPIDENGPQIQLDAVEGGILFGRNVLLPQLREENVYQFVDNISLPRNRHQIKFGVDIFYSNLGKFSLPSLKAGAAIFNMFDINMALGISVPGRVLMPFNAFSPAERNFNQRQDLKLLRIVLESRFSDFPRGLPIQNLAIPIGFTQSFGNAESASDYKFFSTYFQDDIRVRPNLIIKAGLRYDLNIVRFSPRSKLSFSPRLAIAYQPTKLPKANIRAAYGIFVGAPLAGVILTAELSGRLTNLTFPFPFSILAFNQPGRRFAIGNEIPKEFRRLAIPQLSQNFAIDNNLRDSYAQQATLAIDYTFNPVTKLSLSYNFVRGIKLFGSRDINPIVRPILGDPIQSAIRGRVNPSRGSIFELESAFDSYYHAFTVSLDRRFNNRFSLLTHYTFSKAIDNTVDFFPLFQEIANPLQPGLERGLSIQDVRSRLVSTGVWDLNYSKNVFLRNFRLSTIISLNSGRPYNLLAGVDLDRSGDTPPRDRPAFLGRNVGITPGFATVDLRLTRNFSVKETYRIQAFIEGFNLFNRVNIDPNQINRVFLPIRRTRSFMLPPVENGRFIAPPANFRGAFPTRQIQLGLRLSF